MMSRETYQIRQHGANLEGQRMFAAITLPAIPGVCIGGDRHETAPRLLPVRGPRIKAKLSHAAQERAFDRAADALAAKIAGLGVLAQVVL